MLEDIGFVDVVIGAAVDTFGGSTGEANARTFEVYGHAFMARRPVAPSDPGSVHRPVDGGERFV
jgi:hypothetical protein